MHNETGFLPTLLNAPAGFFFSHSWEKDSTEHNPIFTLWLHTEDTGFTIGYVTVYDCFSPDMLIWDNEESAHISYIQIDEEWRGQGLSYLLCEALFDILRARGRTVMWGNIANPKAGSIFSDILGTPVLCEGELHNATFDHMIKVAHYL